MDTGAKTAAETAAGIAELPSPTVQLELSRYASSCTVWGLPSGQKF